MLGKCCICQSKISLQATISEREIGTPPAIVNDVLFQCFESSLPNHITENSYICGCCEDKLLEFYNATLTVVIKRMEFQELVKSLNEEEIIDFDACWSSDEMDSDEDLVLEQYEQVKLLNSSSSNAAEFQISSPATKPLEDKRAKRYCQDCEAEFPTEQVYKLHIKKFHSKNIPKKIFTCSECCIELSTEVSYKAHMKDVHNRNGDFQCDTCDRSFNTHTLLIAHKATHKAHTCTVCGKTMSVRRSLLRHMQMHSGEKKHLCTDCGSRFPSRASLRRHMLVHDDIRDFGCSMCEMRFRNASNLKRHQETHASGAQLTNECMVCGKRFPGVRNLRMHMVASHIPKGSKPCQCSICGKEFSASCYLRNHMYTHTKEKQHQCSVCGKQFVATCYLNSHMKSHKTERQHECLVCGKQFESSSYLRNHLKSHKTDNNGLKQYECLECGRQFTSFNYLKNHMLSHNFEYNTPTQYKCLICEKNISSACNLNRHMKIHKRIESLNTNNNSDQ